MGSLGTNKASKNDKKARKAAAKNTIPGETSHKGPIKLAEIWQQYDL